MIASLRGAAVRLLGLLLATALAVLTFSVVAPTTPARADDAVVITVLSPTKDAKVRGTVEVRARITAPADRQLSQVRISIGPVAEYVGVDPVSCASGCVVSARVDTTSSTSTGEVRDGPNEVAVTARFDTRPWPSAAVAITVDNLRPTVAVARAHTGSDFPLTARDGRVALAATVVARDPAARITAVEWTIHGATVALTPPVATGRPWTADVAARPGEYAYGGELVARDSHGNRSVVIPMGYVVASTFEVSAPQWSAAVHDDQLVLPVTFRHAALVVDAWVSSVEILVDGRAFETVGYQSTTFTGSRRSAGTFDLRIDSRISAGPHRITIVVNDSRGLSVAFDRQVEVIRTRFATWRNPPTQTVIAGSTVRLSADFRSTSRPVILWGFGEQLTDGSLFNIHMPDFGDYGMVGVATATWRTGVTGRHTLRFTAYTDSGTVSSTVSVLVIPRAVGTVAAHAAVRTGSSSTVAGKVADTDGRAVAGVPATLQRRPHGTSRWTSVATRTSTRTGAVSFAVAAAVSTDYRIVIAGRADRWAGSTGPTRTVQAYASVKITKKPTKVAKAAKATISVTAAPGGGRVQLQRFVFGSQSWQDVRGVSARADTTGRATISYRPTSTGRVSLRVRRITDDRAQTRASSAFTLTVG